MWKEFRDFAIKGNVLDLAVAVVIGAAFGKIVTSFVADVLMPPLGLALGGVDFENLFVTLSGPRLATLAESKEAGAVTVNYGVFLQNVVSFFLVAFSVFLLVKQVNRMRRLPEPAAPDTKPCPYCATAIPLAATRCPNCTSALQ